MTAVNSRHLISSFYVSLSHCTVLIDAFDLASFGNRRVGRANTPSIAIPTMTTTLKTIPHFRATTRLGESSGPRISSSTCTPSAMTCTCFPHRSFHVPFSPPPQQQAWADRAPVSYLSSKRLLEVVEAPIALSRHLALPSCETWVHHSHTLALLGDSAHPNLVSCAFQRGSTSDSFSPAIYSPAGSPLN